MKADLDGMFAEMSVAPDVVRPSRMWERLASRNLAQLQTTGIGEFKRTLNSNYFQWLPTSRRDPQFQAVLRLWARQPNPLVLSARLIENAAVDSEIGNPFTARRARLFYAWFVAMLWEVAGRGLPKAVVNALYEPDFGSPLTVAYCGKAISQDLANSALEYGTITSAIGTPEGTIVELGGGYGRLTWVFLAAWARPLHPRRHPTCARRR
jgi:hypothetical protein